MEDCKARIVLGRNAFGHDVCVQTEKRFAHALSIGLTGSGKTVYFDQLIRQDIAAGHGVLVIDPHGGDPGSPRERDSLFARLVAHCYDIGAHKAGKLHIVEPSLESHSASFNPLIVPPGFDIPTASDDVLKAIERVWSEDFHEKPVARGMIKAVVSALLELNLIFCEAKLLLDDEPNGFRASVIPRLKNENSRTWLERLERYSKDKNKTQFNVYASAPFTRFSEFTESPTVRALVGQTDRQLDLLKIMDEGHICLVNLQQTGTLSEDKARLIGTLLFRYVYRLSSRRATKLPFFVYMDEAPKFLTDDIPTIFPEVRKYKIGLHFATQYLRQLGKDDEEIRAAVTSSVTVSPIPPRFGGAAREGGDMLVVFWQRAPRHGRQRRRRLQAWAA